MWEGFEYNDDTICRDIFLLGLSGAICEEKLNDVPPSIMQQLVSHLAEMHMYKVQYSGCESWKRKSYSLFTPYWLVFL